MTHIKLPYIRLRPTRFPFVKILTSELSLLPLNANSRNLWPPQDPHPITLSGLCISISLKEILLGSSQTCPVSPTGKNGQRALTGSDPQSPARLLHQQTNRTAVVLPVANVSPLPPPRFSAHSVRPRSRITLAPILLRPAAPRTCTQLGPVVPESCLTCPLSGTWCCRPLLLLGLGRSPLLVFFLLSGLCIPASHEGSSSSNCPAQKQTPSRPVTGAATTSYIFLPLLPPCSEFSWSCGGRSLRTVQLRCPGLRGSVQHRLGKKRQSPSPIRPLQQPRQL